MKANNISLAWWRQLNQYTMRARALIRWRHYNTYIFVDVNLLLVTHFDWMVFFLFSIFFFSFFLYLSLNCGCACALGLKIVAVSSFMVDVTPQIYTCIAMQIGRCAITIRSGYTVWHVMKWQKSYVKLILIRLQHHLSGHSTIRVKQFQLICHKMDLRNIPEHHHDCLIHRSRFVICL